MRFNEAFKTIKSLLDRNVIGNVVAGQACAGSYQTLLNAKTDSYLNQPWGLVLTYTHEIDYLRWLLGPVTKASGFHARLGQKEKRPDPNVLGCVLQFETGAVVALNIDYVQSPPQRSIVLIGDSGKICYSTLTGAVTVFKNESSMPETIDVAQERDESFVEEHSHFFSCVEKKLSPVVDVHDALETLKVAYLLIDSLKGN